MGSGTIAPIRTDAAHAAALREIARLWESEPGTAAHDRLEVLATLVDAYESMRWPIEAPDDPIAAIRTRMEELGLGQKHLAAVLGSASRASEILGRRRRLTVEMIWAIAKAWRMPTEVLVRPYRLAGRRARVARRAMSRPAA